MKKVNSYKCPECKSKYKSLTLWENHVRKHHPDLIFEDFTASRYYYYILTKKKVGSCYVCKGATEWNNTTQKYSRFCNNPKCKESYRNQFKNRMVDKYGKTHLLNDPDQQRKMLLNRKISGTYTFRDGHSIDYVGTYEKDFLQMLDIFLGFNGADIMSPSPHTYYYDYVNSDDRSNEGKKFYIPDFYIPSANLEIEIKQNTNTHPGMIKVDKVKENIKDDTMKSNKSINYFKIVEKDYTDFFTYLTTLADAPATESMGFALEAVKPNDKIYEPVKITDFESFALSSVTAPDLVKSHKILKGTSIDAFPTRSYAGIGGEILFNKNKHVASLITRTDGDIVWIEHVYVVEKLRQRNIANQLINRAIRKHNATKVKVPVEDTIVIDMFRSNGFEIYLNNDKTVYMAIPN